MSRLRSKESERTRQLTSEVHNGAACADVCTLCEQPGKIKYSHPKTWKDKTALQQLKIIEPRSFRSLRKSREIAMISVNCRLTAEVCAWLHNSCLEHF